MKRSSQSSYTQSIKAELSDSSGQHRSRSRTALHRILLILTAGISTILLTGCNPLYVLRAGYEEGKILLHREKIDAVIQSGDHPEEITDKLRYVVAARNYSRYIHLLPGESYTRYTHVDRDVLVWVLLGSRPDSFHLHTWWYPIVGRVPYKGFFEKPDAHAAAATLAEQGYETWVRGSEAFSTLGWFNDPVLTPTLRNNRVRIVNTVLHETFHRTVWIPNHVDFNESAANFVGLQGAINFFSPHTASRRGCSEERSRELTAKICDHHDSEAFQRAVTTLRYELELSTIISGLYDELTTLYDSDRTKEEKLVERQVIFARHIDPLRQRYPKMRALKSINNAEIMQLKLYLTGLDLFWKLYLKLNGSWSEFIAIMERIADTVDDDRNVDPFQMLRDFTEQ